MATPKKQKKHTKQKDEVKKKSKSSSTAAANDDDDEPNIMTKNELTHEDSNLDTEKKASSKTNTPKKKKKSKKNKRKSREGSVDKIKTKEKENEVELDDNEAKTKLESEKETLIAKENDIPDEDVKEEKGNKLDAEICKEEIMSENEVNSDDNESKSDNKDEEIKDKKGKETKEEIKENEKEEDESESDDDNESNSEDKKSTTEKETQATITTSKDPKNNKTKENDGSTSLITTSTFPSLGVHKAICASAEAVGWTYATRIQKETIPHALTKRDIIGLAETGSGKTGTFAIPILQSLLEEPQYRKSIYALVLAPTRELAFQIQEVFNALGSSIGVNSVCIVGGVDMSSQAIALARLPHVVIATPGRLLDHLQNTKGFNLSKIKFFILDEADRMLSLDFEEEINQILAVIPDSSAGRQTMLFSATMTSKVQKLQRASLFDPIRVEVSTKFQTPDTLLQYYLFIPAKYKDCYFTYLVANECKSKSMLVFVSTCNNAQRLALLLRNLGLSAICLHGQMNQSKRLGALHKFKSGARDILICTDVASRGLDIPHVDVVVNYELPNHGKDYIHRVGRTARAGRSGQAYALVTQYDVEVYQRLEALLGQKLPEYSLSEELVLILLERVNEAQRLANRELREQLSSFQGKGKRRRGGAMKDEDGMESEIQRELQQQTGFKGGSGGFGGALPNQRGSGKNSKKYRHKK